jgi:NitT/TauT family transport system substrate-binding protein
MRTLFVAFVLALCALNAVPASADDTLRVAVSLRGLWNTSVVELGQRSGIFKKHGLSLDIDYTQDPVETLQKVISGAADIGTPSGAAGAFAAFAKGAPLRIIGAETVSGAGLFWYVGADSAVRTLRDADGLTIAYSTSGSSSHAVLMALISQYGVKARPVATGGPAATLIEVMSGLTDVGWAAPPFGLTLAQHGKIRIVAHGADADVLRNRTVRVIIANAALIQERQPAVERFMRAYRETIDWMYADPAVFRHYAAFMGVSEDIMRRARDEFYPKAVLDPDVIHDVDAINAEAVRLGYMPAPLTPGQLAELLRIPPR